MQNHPNAHASPNVLVLHGHCQTPLPAPSTSCKYLTSSVADVVRVAANTKLLIQAPLDLAAFASQTNVHSAVSEPRGVQSAVD